jgi:hypothetical protein
MDAARNLKVFNWLHLICRDNLAAATHHVANPELLNGDIALRREHRRALLETAASATGKRRVMPRQAGESAKKRHNRQPCLHTEIHARNG